MGTVSSFPLTTIVSQQLADLSALTPTDGNVIVGNGTNFVTESGATARTSLGVGTGDSPQFTGVELGHATDTTITRVAAGRVAVEGVGLVKGPASAVSGNAATFSGVTGDVVQDSGKALPTGTIVGTTDTQALTGKTYEGLTVTSTTGSLTITNAKTLSVSNTLTLSGTDGSSINFGAGGTVAYTSNNLSAFASTTSAQLAGVLSDETGTGSAVFGTGPTLSVPAISDNALFSAVVAPASPATNKSRVYIDATTKALTNKDDAGVLHTTVIADTGASNNFLTAISAGGVISKAQPSVSNLSGFGIGVATALAANVGSAGAPVTFNGAGGTPSSLTLTNATGLPTAGIVDSSVTNAKIANSAAYTLKGNFTGSSAAPQDSTIGGLTQKASPASTDLLLIQDQAAAGQLKYATVSSVSSAGSVASIAGNTGAFTLSNGITNSVNDIRIDPATQADQETATSTVKPVTPGRQQYHPSAAKGWCMCNFAGTAVASYNVSSVTDAGSGNQTINWTTSFSSANYCVVASVVATPGGSAATTYDCMISNSIATGSANVFSIRLSDFAGIDASYLQVAAFGDQ